MPNWCDCTYKCVGDLKEVKSLYKILKYIDRRKTSIEKNGYPEENSLFQYKIPARTDVVYRRVSTGLCSGRN